MKSVKYVYECEVCRKRVVVEELLCAERGSNVNHWSFTRSTCYGRLFFLFAAPEVGGLVRIETD